MSDDEVRILADAAKMDMEDRVVHTNWKARSAAYDAMKLALARIFEDTDPLLGTYAHLFVKAVTDSNAAAQDKALEALLVLQSKASDVLAAKYCDRTCSNIVAKCLNGRASTVMRATDVLIGFVELEQGDKVVASLIEGFVHKVPKVVIASLEAVLQLFRLFGAKVIAPQPVLKALPKLFETKDGKARDKVKDLVVEMSRWVGADLIRSTVFTSKLMRDAMKDDIERGMTEAAGPRPTPGRLTRKEAARQAAEQASGNDADTGETAEATAGAAVEQQQEEEAEVDPYEFAEPKDILAGLKKEFWENLEAKKWSDRKASLTQLKEAASYPRLASGREFDYGDVNRELRKAITKDANVMCVSEAIACCGALAKGLRSGYSNTAKNLVGVVLEKFKEKNSSVTKGVAETLTIMHKYCWDLTDVTEDFSGALAHTNPKVREESLAWLSVEVGVEEKGALVKLAPQLLPAASKCAEDALPTTREAAMAFLVAFATKVGKITILDKYTTKMDEGRKKKLEETVLAQLSAGSGAAAGGSGAVPDVAVPVYQSSIARGAPSPRGLAATMSRPRTAAVSSLARTNTTKASTTSAAAGAGKKVVAGSGAASAGGPPPAGGDDEASLSSGALTKDDAFARFNDLFGESTVKELGSEDWKVRLGAMETVVAKAQDADAASAHCSVLVQGMQHLPGWGEKNFQVMAKQFEVVRAVADAAPNFSKRDAFSAINAILDKLADMKLKGPALEALMAMSDAFGPQWLVPLLHKKAVAHKNPKVLSETLNWLSIAIDDYGLACFDVRALLALCKEDLASTNAGVRNSAIHLLGVMHKFLGPPLGDMIRSDVKPALMSAIDGEFAKCPKHEAGAFQASRRSRAEVAKKSAAASASAAGSKGGGGGALGDDWGADGDDLLPRQDLSASITSTLITNMGSANWKERKAAMDDVENLLTSAGGRIAPQAGDLFSSLKARLSDSNKNLTIQAILLLAKLARAMGRPIDRQARQLLGPALKNVSDQKAMVRNAVVELLDAWAGVAGAEVLITEVSEAMLSVKCSSDGKVETLRWAATGLIGADLESREQLPYCLHMMAAGSTDKVGEVRDASGALAQALLSKYSVSELQQAAGGMEAAFRKPAMEAIAKVTGGPVPVAGSGGGGASVRSSVSGASALRSSVAGSAALRTSTAKTPGRDSAVRTSTTSVRSSLSLNKGAPAGVASVRARGNEEPDGPLILLDTRKPDRAKRGKFRTSKFEVRPEEAANLEIEISPMLSAQLKALMFVAAAAKQHDFKRHSEAAQLIMDGLAQELYGEVMGILDLLLRWSVLRIVESNTQSLMKVLELLKAILTAMIEREDRLSEYEARIILPALVEKSGHNQDKIKAEFKELFALSASVYPPPKIMLFVKDGLECKNNKTKVICAEEVAAYIEREGPTVYRANKQADIVGTVARLVTERDTALRQGVLLVMEAVYACEGNGLWRVAGKLSDQQRSLIEERLKYTDKDLARMGVGPGYRSDFMGPEVAKAHAATAPANSGGGAEDMDVSSPSIAKKASPVELAAAPSVVVGSRIGQGQGIASPTASQLPSAMAISTNFGAGGLRASVAPSPIQSLSKLSEDDMQADFRRCMEDLAGENLEEAVQVMKLFCYELMDLANNGPAILTLFQLNMDEIVATMALRTEEIFSEASVMINSGIEPNPRACKYALNTLMNIFQNPAFATCMREGTLCSLMSVLLFCLVDESMAALKEGMAMLKALNLLMMKILENCNRTHVFGALMLLLRQPHVQLSSTGGSDMETRWYDLVVKCMIKVTKNLSATIDTIDLSALLLSIHNFFEALGGEEIRRRGARDDKPLRMVKTILHEVCKFKGVALFDYANTIPGADLEPALRPIIFPYIDLNMQTIHPQAHHQHGLRTSSSSGGGAPAAVVSSTGSIPLAPRSSGGGQQPHAGSHLPGQQQPASETTTGTASVPPSAALSLAPSSDIYRVPASNDAAARNMLAAIFKRIAEKDHQALVDLHFFMQHNPEQDIDSMLSSASTTFKSFIQRGLYKVRVQIMQQQQQQVAEQVSVALPTQRQQQIPGLGQQAVSREARSWGSPIDEAAAAAEGGGVAVPQTASGGGERMSAGALAVLANGVLGGMGGNGSPDNGLSASPSGRGRVGEDKMAELRDRMKQMQMDFTTQQQQQQQTRASSASGIPSLYRNNTGGSMSRLAAAAINTVAADSAADKGNDTMAMDVDNGGGSLNSMAALQERIKRLGMGPA